MELTEITLHSFTNDFVINDDVDLRKDLKRDLAKQAREAQQRIDQIEFGGEVQDATNIWEREIKAQKIRDTIDKMLKEKEDMDNALDFSAPKEVKAQRIRDLITKGLESSDRNLECPINIFKFE